MTLTDAELYEGFSDKQIQEMKREVQARYDPDLVRVADQNVRNMSKAQLQGVKEEGEAIAREMAELMDQDVASPDVQATDRPAPRPERAILSHQRRDVPRPGPDVHAGRPLPRLLRQISSRPG